MIAGLPIAVDDLIHARNIESARVEFKRSWSEPTREQVMHTICAFANDLHNLNGGYIIVGIDAPNGVALLPPEGIDASEIDAIQKEIRGTCKRIDPEYVPVLCPETIDDRSVLLIWVPGGETRPYSAPRRHDGSALDRAYYVRVGSETVEARGDVLRQLMDQAARVPFDDRPCRSAALTAVSESLIRQYLRDVRSRLADASSTYALGELLRSLRLSSRLNGAEVPRNVALLHFSDDPESYFPGARIEVVQFADDAGGSLIEELSFRGPLQNQIRSALQYLDSLSASFTQKVPGRAEVDRFVAFPYEAMEESLANAVLHRSYESPPEPIKVYLYPDRLEITSYPGPVPGLMREHLRPGARIPPLPMRNRRVGEFLKELRLAEMRNTGIPTIHRKMAENGSPEPVFDFDEARTYFRVTLPAHPGFIILHALREAAQLWAGGQRERAVQRLIEARRRAPLSGALAAQLIEYAGAGGDMPLARSVFSDASALGPADRRLAYAAMARVCLDRGEDQEARRILGELPPPAWPDQALEHAILLKRGGDFAAAHKVFDEAAAQMQNDAKFVHEFAQTKNALAAKMKPRNAHERQARRRLNLEAAELLRRAIRLAENPTRQAWAWFDLARTLTWLKAPEAQINEAIDKAIALDPSEPRFVGWRDLRAQRRSRE